MKNSLIIFVFTLLVTLFYNYVGQLVPQKEVHPPKEISLGAEMSTEQMIEAGKEIVEGKGTCMSCHNGNRRFPVFEGIGARAKSMIEGYSDVEYLAESLYEPDKFIVAPFAKGMPAANKPPIGLSDQEILTVIAYLQSLGGTASVTMQTELKYQSEAGSAAPASSSAEPAAAPAELSAEEIITNYACATCHNFEAPEPGLGPSLYDIGSKMDALQLYEALMDPDKTVAEGFGPGMMGAMLNTNGFYKNVSAQDLKKLIDHLASLKGGK